VVEPVGLYCHIPFCRRRCDYCHFAIVRNRPDHHRRLIKALQAEWQMRRACLEGRSLATLYLGGGTPSLLDPPLIAELLTALPAAGEVTLEVNPEDATLHRLREYRAAGINRVSIGVQTTNDALLQALGRQHTAQQVVEAIEMAASAGFFNISADLIFELPHQTLADVEKAIADLVATPITHLSLYNLTLEPPAPLFWRAAQIRPHLPTEESGLQMVELAIQQLQAAGFERYEISAFCRGPFRALHNSGYWRGYPFLGLGPSAWSFIQGVRTQNSSALATYLARIEAGQDPTERRDEISPQARRRELLAIGLRLVEGVDLGDFERRFGPFTEADRATLDKLVAGKLATRQGSHFRLTRRGLLLHDTIAAELI
jgi:oxygen-independent coproporphyrinogen III oxidase